eukprot:286711-Chlamydomonas_euryale.AAC.1
MPSPTRAPAPPPKKNNETPHSQCAHHNQVVRQPRLLIVIDPHHAQQLVQRVRLLHARKQVRQVALPGRCRRHPIHQLLAPAAYARAMALLCG